jgi:hypothetical protein
MNIIEKTIGELSGCSPENSCPGRSDTYSSMGKNWKVHRMSWKDQEINLVELGGTLAGTS